MSSHNQDPAWALVKGTLLMLTYMKVFQALGFWAPASPLLHHLSHLCFIHHLNSFLVQVTTHFLATQVFLFHITLENNLTRTCSQNVRPVVPLLLVISAKCQAPQSGHVSTSPTLRVLHRWAFYWGRSLHLSSLQVCN